MIPLKFCPTLHTESLKRRTQILFAPDISAIINKCNVLPNQTIVEAGIGSGSLSHSLMQAIMPSGKLYNFDLYQERVEQA